MHRGLLGRGLPFSQYIILAGVCFVGLLLQAQTLHAETLFDALAQAYRYSPQLDAQRATLRATDESVSQANAGHRPNINAEADVGRQSTKVKPDFINGRSGETTPRGYTVQLIQPIFKGFQVTNAVNSAEATVRAGRETLRNVEQQVLLDVVSAYGNVVRDQAILRLREDNLKFLNTELKATKERFAVGEVTKTDVSQSQASLAQGQSDLEQAKANLKSSRALYEQFVGTPPRNLSPANPNSKLLPKSLDEAIAIGTKENPQVVAALYNEQAARFQVDEIRGQLLPQAQLEATYTDRFDGSVGNDEVATASIVGRLNVPIYANGGIVYSQVRQAKQTHLSQIQVIEQQRALTQSQVAQSWSQFTGFKAQLVSDNAQIASNKVALDGVREEEKVGQRTLIEVLNQQQTLLNSQVQMESTKRNVVVGAYTVIQAIGRLSVAEVGAASTVYDPEVHYGEVRDQWWGIDITRDDGSGAGGAAWDAHVERVPVK